MHGGLGNSFAGQLVYSLTGKEHFKFITFHILKVKTRKPLRAVNRRMRNYLNILHIQRA